MNVKKFGEGSNASGFLLIVPIFCIIIADAPPRLMPKRKTKHTPPQELPLPVPPVRVQSAIDQRRAESREEDSQLINRALDGDQRAFRRLRAKYYDAIHNLMYRMLKDKDEVDDLAQEAFIKAFGSLASFNDEFAFSTWLYKIASNNCIDYIRKKRLQTFSIDKPIESKDSDFTFELPDSTYAPDRELIAAQRTKLLQDAIDALPSKYRQVILMRHVEEKEYSEIAKTLKLPLGTVKAHIFRAREILYRSLRSKMRHY